MASIVDILTPTLVHLITIPLIVWLTYYDSIQGTWVSDDIQGIAIYNGKMQKPLSWGNVFKMFRWMAGRIPNRNTNWKRDKQQPYVADSKAHHRLSIWITCGALIGLYSFLAQVVTPSVAWMATILLAVHPLGAQTIAWISGIGYITSLLFTTAALNFALMATAVGWTGDSTTLIASMVAFGFLQWMAVEAQFAVIGVTAILAFLGLWPFAIVAGLISLAVCLNTFGESVTKRRATFKAQKMERSTHIYPRKIVTVMKTLFYYTRMAFFPKRMGLYHTFGYHYEMPYIEHEDRYFVGGILVTLAMASAFIFPASLAVRLAIIWFVAFIAVFLNWITAHQFVSERYVWIPALGMCLIAAAHLPPAIYWALFGIALARTWAHIPTYYNETQFYQSNITNFPDSEVALGNLGVVYQNRGMVGTAMDTWAIGAQISPEYDVNWYNLSSLLRSRGYISPAYAQTFYQIIPKDVVEKAHKDPKTANLQLARYCLERAVNCRTCHFPDIWKKELADLDRSLRTSITNIPVALVDPIKLPHANLIHSNPSKVSG